MQESLYDRFRPFKPYDLILSLVLVLIVAFASSLPPVHKVLMLLGGVGFFILLNLAQRWVRVPTPWWEAAVIVHLNTAIVVLLVYLHREHRYGLAFSVLNVAFATMAFGQHMGIAAAVLSVACLAEVEYVRPVAPQPLIEWGLFLSMLLTFVAILTRVNRLQEDALFDAVTGLRNHRFFQVRLREELQRTDRYGKPTALLLIDIDNFKEINDRHGHSVGDQILRRVSMLLKDSVRAVDVVCRYGGDELAVILPDTPLAEAAMVAERFRQIVNRPMSDRPFVPAVSAGVAVYPDHALEADSLISAADVALYRAKYSGKNCVVVADKGQTAEINAAR